MEAAGHIALAVTKPTPSAAAECGLEPTGPRSSGPARGHAWRLCWRSTTKNPGGRQARGRHRTRRIRWLSTSRRPVSTSGSTSYTWGRTTFLTFADLGDAGRV